MQVVSTLLMIQRRPYFRGTICQDYLSYITDLDVLPDIFIFHIEFKEKLLIVRNNRVNSIAIFVQRKSFGLVDNILVSKLKAGLFEHFLELNFFLLVREDLVNLQLQAEVLLAVVLEGRQDEFLLLSGADGDLVEVKVHHFEVNGLLH